MTTDSQRRFSNAIDVFRKRLRKKGVSDHPNHNEDSPLHIAAEREDIQAIEFFLELGVDLEQQNRFKSTPLHTAALRDKPESVRVLCEHGADVDALDIHGYSPLLRAALKGHNRSLEALCKHKSDVNFGKYGTGSKALHYVAEKGNEEAIRILFKHGAHLDNKGFKGQTALHFAAVQGHDKTVNLLIGLGAALDIKDDENKTAAEAAEEEGKHVTANLIIMEQKSRESGDQRTPLHFAATHGDVATVKSLCQLKVPLNVEDSNGNKPLDHLWHEARKITEFLTLVSDEFVDDDDRRHDRDVKEYIGAEKKRMFHLKKFKTTNESLLHLILRKGPVLLKERELLIDLLIKIDDTMTSKPEESRQSRIIDQIRAGYPSSPSLRDTLKSVQERFPWSTAKFIAMFLISVFMNFVIGWGAYGLDVYTDIRFSYGMFNLAEKNFTKELEVCRKNINSSIRTTTEACVTHFSAPKCLFSIRQSKIDVETCLENDQRFKEAFDWSLAGRITAAHCIIPFVFTVLVATLLSLNVKKEFDFWVYPLPPITRLHKIICDWKLFRINMKDQSIQESTSIRKNKIKWIRKLEINNAVINISVLIEASMESTFQFCFQTINLIPTIVLSFSRIDSESGWMDLVNWKIFSIILSFGSFAWAFVSIR